MAIFQVFYEPGRLFASLDRRRGVWILPLVLVMLLALGTNAAVIRLMGMDTIVRQRVQNLRLSPEQMQRALDRANSPGQLYITYAGTFAGVAVAFLLIAGLLTLMALVGSSRPRFSANFSLVVLAFVPYAVVVCLMTVLVLLLAPDRGALDINNLLLTNVGALVDQDKMSRGLYTLLSAFDVLTFAQIGMLSYGFAKVNRTSVSFGFFAVTSLWVVYVLIKIGLSLLF